MTESQQKLADLRRQQMRKLRDLGSRDKPKTPEDHAACIAIARELNAIQAEIDRLKGEGNG